jgi:hypothetical protein
MSYVTINGIRRVPKFTGVWKLSDSQIDILALHHSNITSNLFKSLDFNYRFILSEHSNWIMLGQHLIELLHLTDGTAFRSTCAAMINSMAKSESFENPFVAASIAETNMMPLDEFKKVLQPFLRQNHFGLLPFATGFLNLGDHFSTLWALRMIGLTGLQDNYSKKIDLAIEAIKKSQKDLNKPDFVGFFLFVLLVLERDEDKELIQQLTKFLMRNKDWKVVEYNLRSGGFVAYDLLYASEDHPKVMPIVENWLFNAFSLNEENPTGYPKPFLDSLKKGEYDIPIDVWAQGYIRALIASGLYLKMRRPEYTPARTILANSVITQNQHSQLAHFYDTVSPHIDSYHRLNEMRKDLKNFWKEDENNFAKSVFVSRWMGKNGKNSNVSPIATKIINTIKEELNEVGLICRYSGDTETNYSDNLYVNNEIYMRGCKNCVAVFEGMPGHNLTSCTTNHNVLIETGFMRGKGADVLLLHDPQKSTERPSDWSGILYKEFNQEDDNLIQLRVAVRAWGERIAKELKAKNKDTDDNE